MPSPEDCDQYRKCEVMDDEVIPKILERLDNIDEDFEKIQAERQGVVVGMNAIEKRLAEGASNFQWIQRSMYAMVTGFMIVMGFAWDYHTTDRMETYKRIEIVEDKVDQDHDRIIRMEEGVKYIVKRFEGIEVTAPTVYTENGKGE